MRLRTFTAPDMPAAMQMVREALGENAVILTTQVNRDTRVVNVTAAVEQDDAASFDLPKSRPSPAKPKEDEARIQAEPIRFQLQECLRFHNVPEIFIAKLMQHTSDRELATLGGKLSLPHVLEYVLEEFFAFDPIAFGAGTRVMLVGPPGVGKTLTIARMAAQLAMGKQPISVITTDNKRAGGIEQLQAFTEILDLSLTVVTGKGELAKHLTSIGTRARVLIDTAGCNPYDAEDLKELKSYTVAGIEPVMVLPAGGDSLEAVDMVEAYMEQLPIERLLVTRADTARRFGGVLAAAAAHGLAFCNATGSASITEPLRSLDAALLTRLLLHYQRTS